MNLAILSIILILCLPLLFLPSTFTVKHKFSICCCLITCLRNLICLCFKLFNISLFDPLRCNTHSFERVSIQGILSTLLKNHISTASSFSSDVFLKVHDSYLYKSVDYVQVLRNLFRKIIDIAELVIRDFTLWNEFLAISILVSISSN